MSFTVERFESREDWLAGRWGIGGSMAGGVLGLSRYASPLSCYQRTRGELDPIEDSEAMEWGRILEPVVMGRIEELAGDALNLERFEPADGFVIRRNKERPHLFVTVDGLCTAPGRGRGVVEAKTCGPFLAQAWEGDSVPAHYRAQVDHALAVLGPAYTFGLIGCLIGGQRFVWRLIERDEKRLSEHVERLDRFWEVVEAGDPQPLIDGHVQTSDALLAQHPPEGAAGSADLTDRPDVHDALISLREADLAIKTATAAKREAQNIIKAAIGDATSGQCFDHVIRWAPVSSARLDTKRLKEEMPAIWDQFSSTTEGRRFSVKWGDK